MLIKILLILVILLCGLILIVWLASYAVSRADKADRDMEDTGCEEAIFKELYNVVKNSNARLVEENAKLKKELAIAERIIKAADVKRGLILQSYGDETAE